MRLLKIKHITFLISILGILVIISKTGVLLHFYAKDYFKEFTYPLEGDITPFMEEMKSGKNPTIQPINPHDYLMIKQAKGKCIMDDSEFKDKDIRVVYIVKSALEHFKRREIIRKTWGYEKRFSDVTIKTVFLLGSTETDLEIMSKIQEESYKYGDIIQGNFIDTYYNNTIKTMMGLRWAAELCHQARFFAFFDDDYYVSTRNILRFLRNPVNYPAYLEEDVIHFDDRNDRGLKSNQRKLQQLIDFDLPDDVKLYAGHVFHSRPQRHQFSKWYLTLEEYPFNFLPPYVTAGGYILSREALKDFYYASYFVKRFKFDDVYLGLIAKKIDIEPFHSEEFHFYHKPLTTPKSYRYVVASHGFNNPDVLEKVWKMQKEAGNA